MGGARLSVDGARTRAGDALSAGRERARPRPGSGHPAAPAALAILQRSAGNAAVNALLAGRMRFPDKQGVTAIDRALKESRRDEPDADVMESGLKAAKEVGVPVDLEGIRPPPSALATRVTGFGPGSVPAKRPVPPPKKTPAISPLARAAAKKAPTVKGAARQAPDDKAGTEAGGLGSAAPPTMGADALLQPPVRPSLVRPDDDPAFTRVTGKVKTTAREKRSHPPAQAKAKEAQDAALAPAGDIGSQAKAAKADTMEAQRPGSFDKKAFIAAVKTAIEAKSPKTLKEADNYKESGKAGEVKGEVKALVGQGKQDQAGDIEAATEAPPDASKALPKQVTPMGPEPAGALPPLPAAGAVPKPAPADQLNLAAGTHETTNELAEADVSEQQLAESNEPQFTGALADKKEAAAHAEAAPAAYRKQEADALQQTKTEAQAETTAGLGGMQSSRGAMLGKLVADKGRTKTKDEAKRTEVTTKVENIFNAAEGDVKKILDGIDEKVDKDFTAGEAAARQKFEEYVSAKMSAYKEDRYGGWLGPFRWARDKIRGMPDKVNEFYVAGRELYLKEMEKTITLVADTVGKDLNAAKARIARGQAETAAYVKSLPQDLRKIGAEASSEIGERFEQLEGDVDAKQDALVDTLATKYVEARKGLDERIEELQAENRGLIDKAIGAIKAVINTIRELVAMLTGVLARAASVIGQIIKHPIRFLENLVAGVKGGILKFKEDFLGHLRRGLMNWLFGALAEGGIELPKSFDVKGIIGLLASIFGLTWANIRNRLVKQIGEKAMGAIERGVEIFRIISGPEGVGGLWQMLMDKLGDIKDMIFSAVKDFVLTRVIVAGVTWLIGLLNPAAAFIKACKLIYDVVMFFVNNASRIKKFVDTILDSMADIMRGNISGVVNKINDVLGQMVPIIIGFLASVIGLGGIGAKVREIIQKLQKPVNKAVDFLIKKGLQLAGPIIRKLSGVAGKVKAKVAAGKAWAKGKAEAGKKWVKSKVYGGDDSPEGKQKRLDLGVGAGVIAANRFAGKPVGAHVLSPLLTAIRVRRGLATLEPVARGGLWAVRGEVQRMEKPTDVPTKGVVKIGIDPRTVVDRAKATIDAQRKAGTTVGVDDLTKFIAGGENRITAIDSNAQSAENKALAKDQLARELGAELIAIGQRHRISAISGYTAAGMPVVDINRLVYEVLNIVRGTVTRRVKATGADGQPGEDLQVAFDRVMRGAAVDYENACRARLRPSENLQNFTKNVFPFGGNDYFVDHENNYIIPDAMVGTSRGSLNGLIYVSSTSKIHDTSRLKSDSKRKLINDYRYKHRESEGQFRIWAEQIANGRNIPAAAGAIFAAAMIAEVRRNPNAHVTNLLLLGQGGGRSFAAQAPMAGGGTDTGAAPRDPTLSTVPGLPQHPDTTGSAQPPTEVTDQEIALLRRAYEQEIRGQGDTTTTLEKFVADSGREWVKLNMIGFVQSRTRPLGFTP